MEFSVGKNSYDNWVLNLLQLLLVLWQLPAYGNPPIPRPHLSCYPTDLTLGTYPPVSLHVIRIVIPVLVSLVIGHRIHYPAHMIHWV